MDKENTLILVGDSPFLGSVQGKLQQVLKLYPSMGINATIVKHKTDFHVFQDYRMARIANRFPEIKSVTSTKSKGLVTKENCEYVDSYPFSFDRNTYEDIIKDGKLAWCNFTHDYAVSWAVYKGYKRVVLIGAADFIPGPHYTLGGDFRYSGPLHRESIKYLSEVCPHKIEVLTCNPKSSLKVPRIPIDDLLID